MRDVDPFSCLEKPLSEGKRHRELEGVQDSRMEKERILSGQKSFHEFLEKEADQAFQGECAVQTKLSEAQSELDSREWKMQNAHTALYETGMHPRKWNSIKRIN